MGWVVWLITIVVGVLTFIGVRTGVCMKLTGYNELSSGTHTILGGSNTKEFHFNDMVSGYRTLVVLGFICLAIAMLLALIYLISQAKDGSPSRWVYIVPVLCGLATLFFFIAGFVGQADIMNGKSSYDINAYCGSGGCYSVTSGSKVSWGINHWLYIMGAIMATGWGYVAKEISE